MPKILSKQELYRLLQRELPQDVYPDGAPSAFFSTASIDAKAKVLETVYIGASTVYDNIFPASANELLNNWEITLFDAVSDASVSLQDRRDRLLAKLRSLQGITLTDMEDVTTGVLGSGADFQIIEYCSASGSWIIGVTLLGDTFLGGHSLLNPVSREVNCQLVNGVFPEVSEEEEELMRTQAFTYEVRIYNQTLTATEESALDTALSNAEPARCAHVITDGLTDLDKIGV